MAAAVARHVGARHVVVTELNPDRLALAEKVADVTAVDAAGANLADVIADLGMSQGFDVGLEMSGSQAALDQMVEAMVMGGRIADARHPTPASRRSTGRGSSSRRSRSRESTDARSSRHGSKMIAMLENGLDVSGVITPSLRCDGLCQSLRG